MAAEKVVPDMLPSGKPRTMAWEQQDSKRVRWQAPVEVGAARVGQLFLFVNPRFGRSWIFKLSLRGEEVWQWHARPFRSGHNNPVSGCPAGFVRKVPAPNHEHVCVEGLNCNCARPITDADLSTHERMFVAFCDRAGLRCGPTYQTPPIQLSM